MAALALSMTQLKTGLFFLSVYEADGITPQSLAGAVLYFHAAATGFQIDKSSPSSGIVISDSAGGADCATLTIDPADTNSPALLGGVASIPCELTMVTGGNTFELNSGTLTIYSNVGTP